MSTEHLTAEQSLKIYKIRASATGDSVSADEADGFIAGYRAAENEVEQQTKQLKEERDVLFEFLKRCFPNNEPSYYALLATARDAINFLDQLNQQNEG